MQNAECTLMKRVISREAPNIYLSMAVCLAAMLKATGETGKLWQLFHTADKKM